MAGTQAIYRRHGFEEIVDRFYLLFLFNCYFMKKGLVLASALLLAGCATYTTAGYSSTPMTKAQENGGLKQGTAYCIIGFGDCTDSRAARDGNIGEIVATTHTNFLGGLVHRTKAYGK